ncbi:MAG: hypothetical protein M0T81_04150 [Thermoplasmatales archaeon]|jgi:hypothetical protein|nr:hypothetical protein [Candidatus Thermoplasmatota archaeon]MDA8143155.1 hypothetical protein [Thermoplasmatales archaeon]
MLSPARFNDDLEARWVSLLFSKNGRTKLEELRSSGADTHASFYGGIA